MEKSHHQMCNYKNILAFPIHIMVSHILLKDSYACRGCKDHGYTCKNESESVSQPNLPQVRVMPG